MFGIGETELVIIVIFGFLLFGPDKLPGMGRTIGRMLRQFREAQEGFTEVVQTEVMDPLNQAMSDPLDEKQQQRAQARAAALDEDSDIEEDGSDGESPRKRETFAERKARLAREKEEREAAAAQEEASAATDADADGADDSGEDAGSGEDAASDGGQVPSDSVPQAEEKPDTSAAALYAMKPKKRPKPAGPDAAEADADVEPDAPAADNADKAADATDAGNAPDADAADAPVADDDSDTDEGGDE